tara:strand:+ start:330 stop:524 length:195 start_codon:yes stop_codon:yes gene_type:complete
MGTLAIGMSVMLLIYAIFLYITNRYLMDNEKSKSDFDRLMDKMFRFLFGWNDEDRDRDNGRQLT